MTYAGIIAAALLALLSPALAEETAPSVREPYQLVRTLQALQDEIARGNLEAHNAQPALLKRLAEKFQEADPAVWKDPRNSRAAVLPAERRGPQVVEALRSRKLLIIDEATPRRCDGLCRRSAGRGKSPAWQRECPRPAGSTRRRDCAGAAALLAQNDLKATIERLDEVRLLMPGTLVEEAALRREIFLAGQVDDFDKFESLAVQYFRRYRHSIYAGNFRQRFALSVARFSFAQQTDRFPRLVAVLDHLDRASQRALYLLIARTALVRGKIGMTDLAAERIMAMTEVGSPDRARARLYRAAARVVTDAHEQAFLDLQQIDAGRLPGRDAQSFWPPHSCSGVA